jgi:hypothetical protein
MGGLESLSLAGSGFLMAACTVLGELPSLLAVNIEVPYCFCVNGPANCPRYVILSVTSRFSAHASEMSCDSFTLLASVFCHDTKSWEGGMTSTMLA